MGTLHYWAKTDSTIKYNELFKPKTNFNYNITLENMVKSACESDFADIYFEDNKNNLVATDNKIYICFENEWRRESEDKPNILLNNINEWLKNYIKNCFLLLGKLKADKMDDKLELEKLKLIDIVLLAFKF